MKFLKLALFSTFLFAGCAARQLKAPVPEPSFPVVTTPLPSWADAWICEPKNGAGFFVCDAATTHATEHGLNGCEHREENTVLCALLTKYDGVKQQNGVIVYWLPDGEKSPFVPFQNATNPWQH